MIDDLRQIAIFTKAIDHGSFRGAASELQLSPSVVSHHIQQLEEKLGVALLYRSTRRLTLTRDGEHLLEAARTMLEVVETGLNDIRGRSISPSGELRITIPSVLSHSRLIDDIASFASEFGNVRLDLSFTDERRHLINDGFDLAIRMGTKPKRGPTSQTLFSTNRIVVAEKSCLTNPETISTPEDLANCELIELTPTRMIKTVFRKDKEKDTPVKFKSQISTNDAQAVYSFAKAGKGLAIVPDFLATEDLASGRMVQLLTDWQLDPLIVFAEWPANAPKGGIIRKFVKQLSGQASFRP